MKEVNMNEMEKYADELFHNGFTCAETVMYTINKFLELGLDEKTFSMCSGFPWGLGGGGCICGALAGASMLLSSKYGRQSFDVTRSDLCFKINNELHDEFVKMNTYQQLMNLYSSGDMNNSAFTIKPQKGKLFNDGRKRIINRFTNYFIII